MGSTSSKFKKYIQNGDEYAAMQIYQGSPELKKSFDPNLSYGESRHHNTAMHYAARYGMKHLLRTFLNDLGGDPNKRNGFDETVLHSACSAGTTFPPVASHISISCVQLTGNGGGSSSSNSNNGGKATSSGSADNAGQQQQHGGGGSGGSGVLTQSAQERRAACIALLLQWRGLRLPSSEDKERIHLDALDRDNNTALHLAAGAGLTSGVRMLLSAGVQTLVKDSRGRTAAERALANGHLRLAAIIEKAMIFSEETLEWTSERWGWTATDIGEEEAEEAAAIGSNGVDGDSHAGLRPQELREAKDRLLVDTSDMLRVSLFTAEALLRDNEWCRDVLVERWMKDATACCQSAGVSLPGGSLDSEHPEELIAAGGEHKTIECGICCEEVSITEAGSGGCGHVFCSGCWERYLRGRVCEGEPRPPCPAPRCQRPAPQHLLQRCLTPKTQRKYLLFDIKAFVESSRGMKWCPIAECGRAVKLHETELTIPSVTINNETEDECAGGFPAVSRGVDCGDFHFFCWECSGEPHPPLSCSAWAKWTARAGAAPPAPLTTAAGGAESAASSLWLLAHCKPCPSCSCPIQKNDGCNHMKCTKCKFDFCWVCLESWKRHGSATGGYFRCTREEATTRAEQTRGNALAEARIQNVEAQEQWRFALQCARYRCHEQRWLAERPLIIAIPAKMKALDPTNNSGGVLEAAARELGLCRRLLIGCCGYSFVLPETAPHRPAFHYAQEELEKCTQRLAGLIASEIVEAPLLGVKRAAAACRRWRLTVMRVVRPPPPPASLSGQELRMMARLLGRGRLDPRDPWRFPLGPRGEPLRVPDPLDPDQPVLQEPQPTSSSNPVVESAPPNNADADVYRINVSEYSMDLIIALEMSRLQMLEEQARRNQEHDYTTLPRSRQRPARLNISVSIGASTDNEDKSLSDDQLKLAIQLSLQEPGHFSRQGGDQKRNGEYGDKMQIGETSTSRTNHHGKDAESGPSWSITKERKDNSQEVYEAGGFSNQDENWSKAADITVGYFLKALGRAPLELPNLALGLDLLGNKSDRNIYSRQNQEVGSFGDRDSKGEGDHRQEFKSRPPLLRSDGPGPRPPLLRQMGGKVRRSWSMGDISIKSSSTDDTTVYPKNADDNIQSQYDDQQHLYDEPPQCSRTDKRVSSKCVQIDVNVENSENDLPEPHKSILKSSETPSKSSKDDPRRKVAKYPKNFPWGEFCCERKCVKTYLAETVPTSPRYFDKKEKHVSISEIIKPETEAPKTVSVDCRGKLNQYVFDFSEKTIQLPDLNSSHLRVNSNMAKLSVAKPNAFLSDKNCLNQNEILGDSFRRHSDHIPRNTEPGQVRVKASSSEKHIGERNKLLYPSPEKSSPKKKTEKPTKNNPSSALSIKIIDQDQVEQCVTKTKRGLETDSSNECESETGIPKSPTLYISGVSICREPMMKMLPPESSPKSRQKGKHVKGSTVIVRVTSPSLSPSGESNAIGSVSETHLIEPMTSSNFSPSKENMNILDLPVMPPSHFSDDVFYDEEDPALIPIECSDNNVRSGNDFPETVYAGCHAGGIMISNMSTFGTLKPDYPLIARSPFNLDYIKSKIKNEEALYENLCPRPDPSLFEMSLPNSPTSSLGSKNGPTLQKSWSARTLVSNRELEPHTISKLKSRSANEPERDREMFQFPKSSTDGALSSVLHVQESNLSSDDFHEALFLLERSPKTRDSKRRKRSKKREKDSATSKNEKKSDQTKKFEDMSCSCVEKFKSEKGEKSCNVENDSPSIEQDEASSAL